MNLNQVTVNVTDMDRAIAFYRELGLVLIVHTHDAYARFECPDGGATFSLHLVEEPVQAGTMVYFECEDLDAQVERLRKASIAFESGPEDQSWLWREARLSDPDGNRICLYRAGEARRFPPWRHEDAPTRPD